jgi:hypothetical protein
MTPTHETGNGNKQTAKLVYLLLAWVLSMCIPILVAAVAYGKLQGKVEELEKWKADVNCVSQLRTEFDAMKKDVECYKSHVLKESGVIH